MSVDKKPNNSTLNDSKLKTFLIKKLSLAIMPDIIISSHRIIITHDYYYTQTQLLDYLTI